MLFVIMIRTARGDQVYWFAGFRPAHGVSIGIDFEVQPISAGLACLAAVLVTAAMTFSWRYFDRVATYYHALMLTFLAGITGFCLTGDLFDLFVWFELMGVSAYALTAYRPEERGPIQGALNFAITNSIGAYLSLSGIALIYGRTGALNMAQIGVAIAKHPADRLVVVAFVLVIAGLLIKSAIVPFHFWLADAHAVAPTPVCVLFSGVMVELGLYGIARVYWSVFGEALGNRAAISHVFLGLGLLTAVTGALFCFRERHIKRMLAFSTISHAGMFLIGIALLTPLGLAGVAVYVIGHGLVKAALFLCTGIVLHRLGSVNESWLHGRGRPLRVTGVVFTLAGLGLADLPPFATFLGKGWIEASAGTVAHARPDRVLGRGRRGRAAGGRRGVLRPRRPARRRPADGQGGRRGDQRNDRRQGPYPAHHARPAHGPGGRGHRRGPHRPARARGPGRGGPLRGPGRIQRDRAVRRARHSPGGPVRRRAHQRDARRRADRSRLGRRGADPGLAGAVLAAPAAAARPPAERLDRRGRPPLPERRGQRLRDVDRHRSGGPRRHLRRDHRLTPGTEVSLV